MARLSSSFSCGGEGHTGAGGLVVGDEQRRQRGGNTAASATTTCSCCHQSHAPRPPHLRLLLAKIGHLLAQVAHDEEVDARRPAQKSVVGRGTAVWYLEEKGLRQQGTKRAVLQGRLAAPQQGMKDAKHTGPAHRARPAPPSPARSPDALHKLVHPSVAGAGGDVVQVVQQVLLRRLQEQWGRHRARWGLKQLRRDGLRALLSEQAQGPCLQHLLPCLLWLHRTVSRPHFARRTCSRSNRRRPVGLTSSRMGCPALKLREGQG